ncbi:restriction endonuclease subunit S [Paenibacillus sp. HW567]|uniref:restriction endonuclease subunit S n=1 Tax=Paenibacillus sp. HW567 TaxID=1034769 RepID=UPI000376BE8A|nr:restriction endonuclease subunit S [Paenibacillus sp. HW567]
MSDKITTSPPIRFAGFTDAWEQRRLVDNVEEVLDYRGKSPTKFGMEWGNEGYLVLSALNVKDGYIDKSVEAKYGDQELFEIWMGEHRLEKGDVLFTTEAPLGNVAQVPDDEGYILNQRAVAFKADSSKTSNNFLAQLLRSPLVQESLNANASGGTAKGIGMKEFAKLTAYVSTQVEEQNKIGAFFSNLDYLITLQQRKLELMKETKKSLLQKMFPKDEADVPEIRFAGFTDAWEQRKFGEEFKKVNERNDGSFGKEHWISVAKMYFQDPEKVQSNNIDTRTYVMRQGDIAFEGHPNAEFKFGRFVANDIGEGVVSELFPIYRHKREYDNNYWKHAIQIERIMSPIFSKSITSSGNSSNKLDEKHFLRQSIFVPTIEEQLKIGGLFKHLDNLITLHQRELNSLKNLKKSLLQQMFINKGDYTNE